MSESACAGGGCPFSRQEWEARLREVQGATESHQSIVLDKLSAIALDVGKIVGRLDIQNGRVTSLEREAAVDRARTDERIRAAEQRAADRATAARVVAGIIATLISAVGLALQWLSSRG